MKQSFAQSRNREAGRMAAKTFDMLKDINGVFQVFRIEDYITFTIGEHGALRAKIIGFTASEQIIVVTDDLRDAGTRLSVDPNTASLEEAETALRHARGFVTIA